jgi:hydrogenase maturation protease
MKPRLAIGLGNPLMGDEGVGWHLAACLAEDPGLPEDVDVICAGTDLLRCSAQIEGRSRVYVIDAILDGAEPGTVTPYKEGVGLEARHQHAHHLSSVEAMKLLKLTLEARFTFVAVSIRVAEMDCRLSPELEGRLPAVVERVKAVLQA